MRYLWWLSMLFMSSSALAETTNPALLAATCAACHGTQGQSQAETTSLAGIDKAFFLEQMALFKSGEQQGTVMNTYAQGLTDTEIELLADFFSQKQP
jgi:cytochrome c553